jgi:hypothetical protein
VCNVNDEKGVVVGVIGRNANGRAAFRCDILAVNAHVGSVNGARVGDTGKCRDIRRFVVEKFDKAMCWVRSGEGIEFIKKPRPAVLFCKCVISKGRCGEGANKQREGVCAYHFEMSDINEM